MARVAAGISSCRRLIGKPFTAPTIGVRYTKHLQPQTPRGSLGCCFMLSPSEGLPYRVF